MFQAGLSDEGHSSSIAFGQPNDCKALWIKASPTPSCHTVVRFVVKMGPLAAVFVDATLKAIVGALCRCLLCYPFLLHGGRFIK